MTTCPALSVEPWAWSLMRLHNHYKAGHLPHAGGLLSQPNFYLEAMSVIDAELNNG